MARGELDSRRFQRVRMFGAVNAGLSLLAWWQFWCQIGLLIET